MLFRLVDFFKALAPLKKQLIKFTMIGLLAVLVDLSCYYILLNNLSIDAFGFISNESVSKTLSFLCGMGVTYTLNKLWTWKQHKKSRTRLLKFTFLYTNSLIINVVSNSAMLYILHSLDVLKLIPFKYFVAFAVATGMSASINFLGQKFWVFSAK